MTPARSRLAGLFEPVAPWSLAAFRIAFGAIVGWDVVRYAGRVREYFLEPPFHFTYFGFEWVKVPPEPWIFVLLATTGAASLLVLLGAFTRLAALAFFFGFGWFYVLEQARYLNHHYLVLLFALLLAWVPSDRVWSLAARRRARAGKPLEPSVPRWALQLVRAQLAIVYVYAAIAKMNGDWLRAQPLKMWLPDRAGLPVIGPLLAEPWMPWLFSYAGIALDLLVAPLMLWRPTRVPMFLAIVAFHLTNASLFGIGIFPWLSIAATTIFFEPDWPRRVVGTRADARAKPELVGAPASLTPRRRVLVAALCTWLAIQILLPLRHFLYPGEVSWTEEGHAFSWHMKLRSKDGRATFVVTDPISGERRLVDPRFELRDWQYRKMAGRPEMILQYAHHLAERFTVTGPDGRPRRPTVQAIVDCSLNGRHPQPLVDPERDLGRVQRSLRPADWIVPLHEPLRPSWEAIEIDLE